MTRALPLLSGVLALAGCGGGDAQIEVQQPANPRPASELPG